MVNLNLASELYYNNIWNSPEVLNYLIKERGLRKDIIERYKIGYAKGNLFYNKYGADKILTRGQKDYFEEYIIFPNYKDNICVHLYGRSYPTKDPIHLTLSEAKKYPYNFKALDKKEVILTESCIDCLTLVQNGFNSVGIYGSGISTEMAKSFKGKKCYIFLDYDNAGRTGSKQVSSRLKNIASDINIVNFRQRTSKKIDINSFFMSVKSAKDKVKFFLENSVGIENRQFGKLIKKRKKTKYDLVPIVEVGKKLFPDYIEKGSAIWVKCPHHKEGTEHNNSLWIGGNKNIFNCFGCNVGGGVVRLIQWHFNLSLEDSEKYIDNTFSSYL